MRLYAFAGRCAAALVMLLLVTPSTAKAYEPICRFGTVVDTLGDAEYLWNASYGWRCEQRFINYWWSAYGFVKEEWDGGWGYEDPCNSSLPLARTFNAHFALGYSSSLSPTCDAAYGLLATADCYAASRIKKSRAACLFDASATTNSNTVTYKQPFFFDASVIERAGTIFHEARHADGCWHNGKDNCPRQQSCDKSWTDGCAAFLGIGKKPGANRYHVEFLAAFLNHGWRGTAYMRIVAYWRANQILNDGYVNTPCHRYSDRGIARNVC